MSLPEAFHNRLQAILPAEHFATCWQSLATEQPTAFRANALKGTSDALVDELTAEGFALTPLVWKTDAFVVPAAQRRALTECAAYREGRLYIQNPSSMVPPILLSPQSEECILDLGAAPGSKTLQLAEMMDNQGIIWAVESVRGRFFRLRDNLARHGAENVQTHLADGTRIWRRHLERFDRVLLDAPCSSEGRFRADAPKTYAYWS
ncbi:MAG: RsmB/NOP family class I SAM-dependent RNA methyltransferase, partial [Gemmatimonadetes bacterium]|nr:RsmB/NOP family class I SAM-dependent RNA methyltransferase [Gemmatimonadota bacterium]